MTAAILTGMVFAWQAAVMVFRVPDFLLPSPLAVGREFLAWPELLAFHTWVTLLESVLGLAAAIAVAVPLAIAVVYSRALSAAIYPILVLLQSVPRLHSRLCSSSGWESGCPRRCWLRCWWPSFPLLSTRPQGCGRWSRKRWN